MRTCGEKGCEQQRGAPRSERQRREYPRASQDEAQHAFQSVTSSSPVPAAIEHEAREDPEREQRKAEDVPRALVQRTQRQQPPGAQTRDRAEQRRAAPSSAPRA